MSHCLYDASVPWCQHKVCYEARQEGDMTPGHWSFTPLSPPETETETRGKPRDLHAKREQRKPEH